MEARLIEIYKRNTGNFPWNALVTASYFYSAGYTNGISPTIKEGNNYGH